MTVRRIILGLVSVYLMLSVVIWHRVDALAKAMGTDSARLSEENVRHLTENARALDELNESLRRSNERIHAEVDRLAASYGVGGGE